MIDELVQVYSALNEWDAQQLANLIEEEGIKAQVLHGASWAGGMPLLPREAPAVWVRSEDQPAAARIAAQYEEHARQRIAEASAASEAESRGYEVRMQSCPDCGLPRKAVCSHCAHESDQFFFEPDEGAAAADGSFVCPICEEFTEPVWSQSCERCGKAFE